MLLRGEVAAARAVGVLSRLTRRGGGTTLPGKLLASVDPGAVERLASELSLGSVVVSATNGKTTTTAMVAAILAPNPRLAYNRAGANLLSGIASTLLASRDAELGLFEVDEAALPEIVRRIHPKIVALGNLFRDQLDRYGELELVARGWREAAAGLPDTLLVVNADDPLLGELAREHEHRLSYGIDDPTKGRDSLQHAADSKHCPSCGAQLGYAAIYVGHLGDYRCPSCGRSRLALDLSAREIELHGVEGSEFTLVLPGESVRISLSLPGLYNVYNAVAAAAIATALGVSGDRIAAGLGRFVAAFGRSERIVVGDKGMLLLLIKNPAGANEVIATLLDGSPPSLALVALNDEIADGRDVSWIWDVDFEPLLARLEQVVVSGGRAAELALRFTYGGLARERIEVVPELERALDRALELTPAGGELVVLPTYTAMLALRAVAARRGLVPEFWEPSRVRITVGHLYPDQLNIYADRGNIAVLDVRARARGHELDVRGLGIGDPVAVDEIDLFYIGGGQDRDQRLVAADLAAKGSALAAAASQGAVFLGVCGGYQLLGRSYHERGGTDIPGIGLLGLETVAGERRLIGDVLIDCEWAGKPLAGFENHGGRTILDAGTPALGRLVAGFGNDGSSGFEGAREGRIYGTYLHGPLLPRNPWFADRLLAESIEHRTGEPAELSPLPDELEDAAHEVAAARALARGGRPA